MSDHFVITVARGFGSGGKEIASKLAHDLGTTAMKIAFSRLLLK